MYDLTEEAKAAHKFYAEFPVITAGPTGPRSADGKKRTSLNAYKHGLTGQIHLFTPAEHAVFDQHCQSILEALAPAGILEQELAQFIAEDKWRLKRARAIETNIFAQGQMGQMDEASSLAFAQAQTWLKQGRNIQLLSLYQQRIERSIERNMVELRALRAERTTARQQALEEALLLAQLAKSKGETYNPSSDSPNSEFVFSTAEIERLLTRKQRLDEARALPKTRPNLNPGLKMTASQ